MKKVAIMQPYFLPYIGYWQLLNSVDEFVIYDNIEYTKKGWFNRNRILENGHDRLFTLPIKKDSDYLDVKERFLSDDSLKDINRTLNIIKTNYRKAPYFNDTYELLESCFLYDNKNLFEFIYNSVKIISHYLDIDTKITISSTINIDHNLKAAQKVLAIAKACNADNYINAIGGMDLYNKGDFLSKGIELQFIKAELVEYKQFDAPFVPGLSIIDILMFNDKQRLKWMLEQYELL